jgi:branched-subunit amino acid aminotransferase/4-amino-4-deoxychorismate lyase
MRVKPTLVMMAGPLRVRRITVSATLLPFAQESFIAEHKSLNYLLAVVGRAYAARHNADEGIYVGSDGIMREGTTSSLFLVRDGSLYTVPTVGILPGVTRRIVLDLAFRAGIRIVERPLRAQDLFESEESFLTSSLQEIVPLVRVDNRPIGNGKPGPVTRRLQRLYQAHVREMTASAKRSLEGVAPSAPLRTARSAPRAARTKARPVRGK